MISAAGGWSAGPVLGRHPVDQSDTVAAMMKRVRPVIGERFWAFPLMSVPGVHYYGVCVLSGLRAPLARTRTAGERKQKKYAVHPVS